MNYPQRPPKSNSAKIVGIVLGVMALVIGTPILLCALAGVFLWSMVDTSPAGREARARRAWERVIEERHQVTANRANRERQAQAQRHTVGPGDQVGALQGMFDGLQENQKLKELFEQTERLYGPIPPDLRERLNSTVE